MADVHARDVIRVLPNPDGSWRWLRDRRWGRMVRREWCQVPALDRETALLDALGLLVEDPAAPRRSRLVASGRLDTPPAWRALGWTAWGP